jgi:uncharacterized membrane protein (Fun14 family)
VAQASSQLQQFTHWLQNTSLTVTDSREFRQVHRFITQKFITQKFITQTLRLSPERLWVGAMGLALLLWNWQLVMALCIGAVVLVTVYLAQQGQWRVPSVNWRRLLTGSNRSLSVAIASGTLAAFSAYVTTEIWFSTEQSWLAIGIILQGFGTLTVLGLLTWQTLNRQFESSAPKSDQSFNQTLADLAETDPLKRLIAVRQITHWVEADVHNLPMMPSHLADCFRLMLDRETESSVCSALLEGLQTLGQGRQLNSAHRHPVPTLAKQDQVEE